MQQRPQRQWLAGRRKSETVKVYGTDMAVTEKGFRGLCMMAFHMV